MVTVDTCAWVRLRRRLAYVRVVWTFFYEPLFPADTCSVLGVAVLPSVDGSGMVNGWFCWCSCRVAFPSVVVRPKMLCIMAGMDQKDIHAATLWPRSSPTMSVACFGVVLLVGCTSLCVLRLSVGPRMCPSRSVWTSALFPSGMSMVSVVQTVKLSGGLQLLFIEGRRQPCLYAEADPHGPVFFFSENHGDSPVR